MIEPKLKTRTKSLVKFVHFWDDTMSLYELLAKRWLKIEEFCSNCKNLCCKVSDIKQTQAIKPFSGRYHTNRCKNCPCSAEHHWQQKYRVNGDK